jgi:hypothetical protein
MHLEFVSFSTMSIIFYEYLEAQMAVPTAIGTISAASSIPLYLKTERNGISENVFFFIRTDR